MAKNNIELEAPDLESAYDTYVDPEQTNTSKTEIKRTLIQNEKVLGDATDTEKDNYAILKKKDREYEHYEINKPKRIIIRAKLIND